MTRNEAHLVEGDSMKAQHKTLLDGTGSRIAWLIVNLICQAQWVMEQRQEVGSLQRNTGRGLGCGGSDQGAGDCRNINNGDQDMSEEAAEVVVIDTKGRQ